MKTSWSLLLAGLVSVPAPACDLAGAERRQLDDDLVVYYRPEPAVPELSRHFKLRLRICRGRQEARISGFRIDARMPAHNHGMNYRPVAADLDDGSLQVSGMLFHMPGLWQVDVEFEHAGRKRRLSIEYLM